MSGVASFLWDAGNDLRIKRGKEMVEFLHRRVELRYAPKKNKKIASMWIHDSEPNKLTIGADGEQLETYDLTSSESVKKMLEDIYYEGKPLFAYRDENFLKKTFQQTFSSPKQEQVERALEPIIEQILRERYGKKELYY